MQELTKVNVHYFVHLSRTYEEEKKRFIIKIKEKVIFVRQVSKYESNIILWL